MIIEKDGHRLEVSRDAYKSMYKRLKYNIVSTKKTVNKKDKIEKDFIDNKNDKQVGDK